MFGLTNEHNLVPRLLKLAEKFNSFYLKGLQKGDYCPFLIGGEQVGLIGPEVKSALVDYPNVFQADGHTVSLNPAFRDYKERTIRVEEVLKQWRAAGRFQALKGWRDEYYEIRRVFSAEPLLKMDRSATCFYSLHFTRFAASYLPQVSWLTTAHTETEEAYCKMGLFGICKYGVTITGFVRDPNDCNSLKVWLQRRSATKQTWPGKWDNMVAGGLSVGFGVLETAHKEAEEEASIPSHLLKNLTSGGCVSFYYESERGIFPNTEFVYDLELPPDFIPTNNDGEVDTFELLSANELVERLFSPDFKTTSCPVVVDFLIRHGVISPDNDPHFPQLVELLHVPLQSLYKPLPLKNGAPQ